MKAFFLFLAFSVAKIAFAYYPGFRLRDLQRQKCGRLDNVPRLFGDDSAEDFISKQSWPWVAWFPAPHVLGGACQGAMVSERWLLTSATCAKRLQTQVPLVRTGDYRMGENLEYYDDVPEAVERIVLHPRYKGADNNLFYNPRPDPFDFAMMRLSRVHYGRAGFNSICLSNDTTDELLNAGNLCQLVGFGNILGRKAYPGVHRQHMLNVTGASKLGACANSYPNQTERNDSLCVNVRQLSDRHQYFYAGGVLQCLTEKGRYVLEGIGWDYFYPDMPFGSVRPIVNWIQHLVNDGDVACGEDRNEVKPSWVSNPPSWMAADNYPWMVLITDSTGRGRCNGVLISNTWVLSSARCVQKMSGGGKDLLIVTNIYDKESPLKPKERQTPIIFKEVLRYKDHHYLEASSPSKVSEVDFLLLRINGTVHGSKRNSPICLPSHYDRFPHMNNLKRCKVVGWGGIMERISYPGQELMTERTVSSLNQLHECQNYANTPRYDKPYCLNLYGSSKWEGTHFFLPGSAFMCKGSDDKWKLWGIGSTMFYPSLGVSNILPNVGWMTYIVYGA